MDNTCKNFFELSVNELLILNLILSILLANGLNTIQLGILGNFILGIGQNILIIQAIVAGLPNNEIYTISSNPAYKEPLDNNNQESLSNEDITKQLKILKEQICLINEILTSNK